MSPILKGVVASGISGHLSSGSGSWYNLSTTYGTGSSGTIDITGIPQTYKHLQIRMLLRGTSSGGWPTGAEMRFNNDTTATNYNNNLMWSNNTRGSNQIIVSYGNSSSNSLLNSASSTPSGRYGASILTLLNYTDTSQYRTAHQFFGMDNNTEAQVGRVGQSVFTWNSTAAFNRFTIIGDSTYTGNWTTDTKIAIYGWDG